MKYHVYIKKDGLTSELLLDAPDEEQAKRLGEQRVAEGVVVGWALVPQFERKRVEQAIEVLAYRQGLAPRSID